MNDQNTINDRESDDKPRRLLPGRRLRAARESIHMSINEAANHLRLDSGLIANLEEDNYKELPSAAYVCGYLRSYARLLKLPEDEIVQAFTHGEDITAALIPENVNILPVRNKHRRVLNAVAVILLMVLIAAGILWIAERVHLFESAATITTKSATTESVTSDSTATESAPNITPTIEHQSQSLGQKAQPAPNPPPALELPPSLNEEPPAEHSDNSQPAAPQVKSARVRLKYSGDSWTEVRDARGEQKIRRLVTRDSEIVLRGEPPFWVLLGYADAVEIWYEGKKFDHKPFQQNFVAIFTLGQS